MSDLTDLTNLIYGEAANQDEKVMKMVGSTVINRQKSGRTQEFGETIGEIAQKGYYAVKNPNQPMKEAMSGKFGSPEAERKYKQAMATASGLLRGTIEPDKGMFYFKPDEIKKLKKTPKVFNFKAVKSVGKSGDYEVFDY
jgi:spore germination cell wall hydrolase CwlJ-like protein